MIDANTIVKVTRNLIGMTEPCGDSVIDRERAKNLDKLIYVAEELVSDIKKVAINKDRHEGSMQMMGEKAYSAMEDLWEWIEMYWGDEDER